jgi:hypothetical protein
MRVLIGGFYKSYSPSNAVVSVMGLFVFGVLDQNASRAPDTAMAGFLCLAKSLGFGSQGWPSD